MADGILWNLINGQQLANLPNIYNQAVDRREEQDIKQNRKSVLAQLALGPDGNLDAKAGLTQLVRAGDLQGAAQFAQTSKMLQPETTDEIKEYNLFRAQGGTDNFNDWKTKLKIAGSTRINNTLNTGDNKYANKLAEHDADRFIAINKAGQDAIPRMNTLAQLERLAKDPDFISGAGAGWYDKYNKALVAVGAGNPKAASAAEFFDSLSNQGVLDALGGKLGAGVSNADVEFLRNAYTNRATTKEGNLQIIQYQKAVTQRQQQVAQLARQYAQRNGGRLDAGFDEQLAQWAERNPLFKGQTAPQAQSDPLEAEMRRRGLMK